MLMGVYMRSIRPGKVGEASAFGVIVLLLKRIVVLPDVPTIGKFVPGYEASGWQGIGAPASTPPDHRHPQ